MKKDKNLIIEQQKLNNRLATLFKENGIKTVRLLSFGNSIASGYSFVRTTKPLLKRNETLEQTMSSSDIKLDMHHFARAQNNNDEHLFEWLINNIKESEIHSLNINDYNGGPTSMVSHGLNSEKLNEYYPTNIENDIGLQDAILESSDDMANIVVYNGCTGSFLDNVTRNGKIKHMLTYGVNRDTYGLEAILKFIQTNNRNNKSNTQVYICGAPDFLGLKISEIINVKLKKIAEKYSNVVYVEPVKSKFFYKSLNVSENTNLEEAQSVFKKYLRQPDVHYDEEEYLKFNNNIIKAIGDNYLITQSMINVDRNLYDFSSNLEHKNQEMLDNKDYIQQYISNILTLETSKIPDEVSKNRFYKRAEKYLINRFPYDFYYIGKKNIYDSLNEKNKNK